LWCKQTSIHLENNLAKFGYIPNMKVKQKEDPSISFELIIEICQIGICFFGNIEN
jgi:hypothetical protein